jgi:hypothetical protein
LGADAPKPVKSAANHLNLHMVAKIKAGSTTESGVPGCSGAPAEWEASPLVPAGFEADRERR